MECLAFPWRNLGSRGRLPGREEDLYSFSIPRTIVAYESRPTEYCILSELVAEVRSNKVMEKI